MNDLLIRCASLSIVLLSLRASQAQDFKYITNNGTITITEYRGPGGKVAIPGTINGRAVTDIGEYAFSYYGSRVTGVTMPNSITSIGRYAFRDCSNLATITLSESLTSIGLGAFGSCTKLESIMIPGSVTNLGSGAFLYCTSLGAISVDSTNPIYSSLDGILFDKDQTTLWVYPPGKAGSYTVPESVTSIASWAFHTCRNLTSLIMFDQVTQIGYQTFMSCGGLTNIILSQNLVNIGKSAFESCTNLLSIRIPDKITSIDEGTFRACSSLPSITIPNSVTNIAGHAFLYCTSLSNVNIHDSVAALGDDVFMGCSNLTNITLSNGLLSIGLRAFHSCTSLRHISIPASVTNIGATALWGCTNLTAIEVDPLNDAYRSADGVLMNASQTELLQFPLGRSGNYAIPQGVATIGNAAFRDSANLTNVTIPASVTEIGPYAFYGCASIASLSIPDSVTNIEYVAFGSCYGLSDLTLGSRVANIGSSAFQACSNLTSVTIPESVVAIGANAFRDCIKLTEIRVDPLNSSYRSDAGVLFDKSQRTLIQYPLARTGSYTIPVSVVSIGESAFRHCLGLTSVTIARGVTNIGVSAFHSCISLAEVFIPDSVAFIDTFAFVSCTSLEGLYFQGDAPQLGGAVFENAGDATVYYLPGTMGWRNTFGGLPTALWKQPEGWIVTSAPTNNWLSVACSADGIRILAAARFDSEGSGSLWLSSDSGTHWLAVPVPLNDWWSVAMSAEGHKMFAVGGNFNPGIYVSTNAGASWSRTNPNHNVIWTEIACSTDGTHLVAGGSSFTTTNANGLLVNHGEVYISTNSGTTWNPSFRTGEGIVSISGNRFIKGVASSADGVRLAAIDSYPAISGDPLFTSIDGGQTWVTNRVDASTDVSEAFTSLDCSADGKTLALGRAYGIPGVFVSKDGGFSWTRSRTNGIWSVTVSADGLGLAALDAYGVICTSRDAGVTWTRNSLPYHTDFGFLSSSADGLRLVAAVISGGIHISQTPPSPVIQAVISGSNLVLSWMIPSQEFLLQTNSDLAADNWVDSAILPQLNYGNLHYEANIPMTSIGNGFYRLGSQSNH